MPLPRYLSLDEFRTKAAAKGEQPSGPIRKAIGSCEIKAVEGESRTLSIRITTGSRDRDRDTIDPTGWKLANYRKNPVVLYAHYWDSLPIAQDTGIVADELGLLAKPKFVEAEDFPFGDMVYRLLLKGFLRAASVGMNPMVWQYNEEERGIDFKEQELLEYSIVAVPANPEALAEAKSLGIDVSPLKEYAERTLDSFHGESGLWVPRKTVERAFQIASGEHLLVTVPKDLAADKRTALTALFGAKTAIEADALLAALSTKSEEPAPPAPPADPATTPPADPAPEPTPAGDPVLLELEPEQTFDVDADLFRKTLAASTTEIVSEALTALTGRLP